MNTTPVATKDELRRGALARRDALDPEHRKTASARIVVRIAGLISDSIPRNIAAYMPIRSEVDVLPLLDLARQIGAVSCLPAVDGNLLRFRAWAPGGELVRGAFNMLEPPASAVEVAPDIIVAPVAGFDRMGARLGYGRGYYDRAVAAIRAGGTSLWFVGAAFAIQELAAIPAEPHDQALDAIATEDEMIVPSASKPFGEQ